MEGKIIGEDDRGMGVRVIDNNGIEHTVAIGFKGEIQGHSQDGYANKAVNRTEEENENVNQTRRFAKNYIYQERGYNTIDHIENPDYIDAVRRALNTLSDRAFEDFFGALHTQLRSHHEDIGRPIDLPADVQRPDAVVYKLDIYLGVDIEASGLTDQARSLADAHGLDYDEGSAMTTAEALDDETLDEWRGFGDHLTDLADDDLKLEISAVSGIHVGFPNERGEHEVEWTDQPLNREPDTRLELLPAEPGSLSEFRQYLDHHLRCQVRDCFVGMGLVPPDPYKVVGFGKFIYARRYDHYDLYPQLHLRDGDHNAVIQ